MKKILFLLTFCLLAGVQTVSAQRRDDLSRYLAGAVPVVDGYVQFEKSFTVKGKTKAEIHQALFDFAKKELVEGPEQLPQARITESDAAEGVIAASIEEYLYFKRTNWVTHRVRFYYQIVYTVKDEAYTVQIRRLHYRYDPETTAGEFDEDRRAEKWITDEEALSNDGKKLTRIAGKFRRFTIDRVDDIFYQSAIATGAKKQKKYKMVEVEDED